MDNTTSARKEQDWELLDSGTPTTLLNTQLEPDSFDDILDAYTTETRGNFDLFSSGDAGALLTEDLGTLGMGASGPRQQAHIQHMWPTMLQDPYLQHNNGSFPEGNIDLESIGRHLWDDWPIGYYPDASPHAPCSPFYDIDPQSMPTTPPVPYTQSVLPFFQGFMEQDLGFSGPIDEETVTFPSLAFEASSSSSSSGSRSSLEHQQPTPTSSSSPEKVKTDQNNGQVVPKRHRKPKSKPKQEYPCSFSPCHATFDRMGELR